MSYFVHFFTEQALLAFVRDALRRLPWGMGWQVESPHVAIGAACVLALHTAVESIVERLLDEEERLQHFHDFPLRMKIETIADLSEGKIDWNETTWTRIDELHRLWSDITQIEENRNTECDGGTDADDYEHWKQRFNMHAIPLMLSPDNVLNYYLAVRDAGLQLARLMGFECHYGYLETEEYEPVFSWS